MRTHAPKHGTRPLSHCRNVAELPFRCTLDMPSSLVAARLGTSFAAVRQGRESPILLEQLASLARNGPSCNPLRRRIWPRSRRAGRKPVPQVCRAPRPYRRQRKAVRCRFLPSPAGTTECSPGRQPWVCDHPAQHQAPERGRHHPVIRQSRRVAWVSGAYPWASPTRLLHG